ncbi:MAG: hypothetical protein H6863_04565 [Rhodospirillales bacterium]|nr:hypothetical protein [Rhodospirillales bacterium]
MKYPEEFKKAVLDVYPDSPDIQKHLENGDEFLGRYLDDSSHGGIAPSKIVELLEAGQSDELLAQAKDLLARKQLYAQWSDLYRQERNLG